MEGVGMREKEYYKKQILEIIKGVNDEKFLEFMYYMVSAFKRKWGV
jgi:hypothetical protein